MVLRENIPGREACGLTGESPSGRQLVSSPEKKVPPCLPATYLSGMRDEGGRQHIQAVPISRRCLTSRPMAGSARWPRTVSNLAWVCLSMRDRERSTTRRCSGRCVSQHHKAGGRADRRMGVEGGSRSMEPSVLARRLFARSISGSVFGGCPEFPQRDVAGDRTDKTKKRNG
jgi:hypothetical protein